MQKKNELLFFIPYILYLVCRLIDTSTFQIIFDPTNILNWPVRILSALLIGIKIVSEFKDWKRYSHIYIPMFGIFLISAYVSKSALLLDVFILIVGAWNIDFEKIIKVSTYTASFMYFAFFMWSILGVIPDATFWGADLIVEERHALGAISPTDFAAMAFYLQISWAYIQKKSYGILQAIIWIAIAIFVYVFCHARLDVLLIILFAIIWLLKDKIYSVMSKISKVFNLVMPLCFAISLILHDLYSRAPFLEKVNSLLSNRLYYGKLALDKYGLKLFGSDFDMYGIGWSLESTGEYNFVDCGYLYVGIQYGILILAIILLGYIVVVNKESRIKNVELPIIISFIAVSSIIDHHIFQIAYNPFMFLLPVAISYYPCISEFSLKKAIFKLKTHFFAHRVELL